MCVFPPLSLQPGLIFWLLSDLLLSDLQIHRVSETMWTWKVSKGPKTMSSRYLQKLVCHPTYRAHIWRRVVLHPPPASLAWRTNGTGSEEGTWFSLVNEALVNIEMPLGTCLRWQRLVKVPYHQSPYGTPCVARLRFAESSWVGWPNFFADSMLAGKYLVLWDTEQLEKATSMW